MMRAMMPRGTRLRDSRIEPMGQRKAIKTAGHVLDLEPEGIYKGA
jgi:hypothetical protein